MPQDYGIARVLKIAIKARLEASMTNESLLTKNVYHREAPSSTQGVTRIVYQIQDDIRDQGMTDRLGSGNDVLVDVMPWGPNATTVEDLGDDIVETMTAINSTTGPTLVVTDFDTIDVTRLSRSPLAAQDAGLKDEYGELIPFRIRLRKTSTMSRNQ